MLYLSISLTLITIIITIRPITFNYNKTITVNQQQPTYTEVTQQTDIDELNDKIPPTYDDLVSTLNTYLHDLEEESNE